MDSDLDIYTVDEQDRLMCYRSRTFNKSKAPSNELEFVEYTGTIDIYTDIPQKGEFGYPNKYIESLPTTTSSRWVEYVLTFEGGILKNVRSMFEDDVE
jgi:hypothetical protein